MRNVQFNDEKCIEREFAWWNLSAASNTNEFCNPVRKERSGRKLQFRLFNPSWEERMTSHEMSETKRKNYYIKSEWVTFIFDGNQKFVPSSFISGLSPLRFSLSHRMVRPDQTLRR